MPSHATSNVCTANCLPNTHINPISISTTPMTSNRWANGICNSGSVSCMMRPIPALLITLAEPVASNNDPAERTKPLISFIAIVFRYTARMKYPSSCVSELAGNKKRNYCYEHQDDEHHHSFGGRRRSHRRTYWQSRSRLLQYHTGSRCNIGDNVV